MIQATRQRLIDILDYWHKIEFFIPFDLDQIIDVEDPSKLRIIRREQLQTLPTDYFQQCEAPPDLHHRVQLVRRRLPLRRHRRRLQAGLAAAGRRRVGGGRTAQRQTQAAHAAAEALLRRRQAWDEQQAELRRLRQEYRFDTPPSSEALELDEVQIAGLWHDEALARLRSSLFAAALTLHEAWLAEVARKNGGFGGNLFALSRLLTNKRPDSDDAIALIWQSLFMVVPVVSTTFASLARQFSGMGEGSLGWLFIDEAGQAVPQAAVGGLRRARRAVVVGDPRQIEPVFTVPLALIRALSACSPHTAGEDYAPDKVSVQRLADDANRYGTLAAEPGGPGLWIGSPLRVHRRCADPMFSLANTIAYEGKMVIEEVCREPAPLVIPMGESAWIDIGGKVGFKQVVPEQIAFVARLVVKLHRLGGALPALYVISPFKAVKNAVRAQLEQELRDDALAWGTAAPSAGALKTWCKANVGTVHTFQGKEQAVVVMVLGADPEHAGSASWASSKANLLNVALTRAQRYFYIVGAGEVWGEMNYFAAVRAVLPVVGPEAFLDAVGRART